ncbi:MAG: alpha-L-fucosidase, partial [Ginsengibacter sp.]
MRLRLSQDAQFVYKKKIKNMNGVRNMSKCIMLLFALNIICINSDAQMDQQPGFKEHQQRYETRWDSLKQDKYRYDANWESLKKYTVPDWFRDAKFGIFIHWGVYAVPAYGGESYGEWYPYNMYRKDTKVFKHHVETYGAQDTFGYKNFIPMFKAEKFNADQWAKLFKEAGAKYVVPV